jgi:uncharacterized membrane protein
MTAVSAVSDRNRTTYVSAADYKACLWLKQNTPDRAVVQCEPEYPGPYEYSLIACFAERAMVISESKRAIFVRVPDIKRIAEERKHEIQSMLGTAELGAALETIKKYGIGYVYIGPYEQRLYPEGIGKFENNPVYFRKVYSRDGVSIFKTGQNGHV